MSKESDAVSRPWWKKKSGRVVLLVSITLVCALFAGNVGGYVAFLLVAIISPRLGISLLIEKEKRRFPIFIWRIYALWWILSSLFHWAFSVRAGELQIGWLETILIGNEIARLIISSLLGLAFALAFVVLPVLTIAFVAAKWVLALTRIYGVSERQALQLMISLILNINQPMWIIEDGEAKESQPKGWPPRLGGPGLVIIRPYNAVVFEQASRITRIEGPGEVRIKFDERIREVVDLRLQAGGYEATQVLTRDRVPLKIVGGAGFRVQRTEDVVPHDPYLRHMSEAERESVSFRIAGRNTVQGAPDEGRVFRRSVYNAVYGPRTGQKWTERVRGDAEGELRKVIRTYDFNEIYHLSDQERVDPAVRRTVLEAVTSQVTEQLRQSASRYGVHVLGTSIKTIEIDQMDNVKTAYFAALGAEWKKRMAITQAQAEGAAFRGRAEIQTEYMSAVHRVLEQFRQALVDMSGAEKPMPREIVERYLQVAERLLQNILTDHSTARRYLETMATFASVSPNTVIAAGVDIADVTDLLIPGLKPPPNDTLAED